MAGRDVQLFLESADGMQRDPEEGIYDTPLDEMFLQDGELFSYVPAANVDPLRRDYSPQEPLSIDYEIFSRQRFYRVLLPRGYDQHLERSYPVAYFYDGQAVWDFGTNSWDRDGNRLRGITGRGLVGEMIFVAIDWEGAFGCPMRRSRGRDCMSPEDTASLGGCAPVTGQTDRFVRFVSEELKPLIDATYRTRPDREHTFAMGYSMGGMYALYAGWEFPEVFGGITIQSGTLWLPAFPARVMAEPREDLRIYLDFGDREESIYTVTTVPLRDSLLCKEPGYVYGKDLGYRVGFAQVHNSNQGGRRMGTALGFLYPATAESANVPWPMSAR